MKRSLRSWLWSVPLDQEVDEELAFHREMRAREQRGAPVDPAVRRTLIDLGRKRDRETRMTRWIHDVGDDIRFALRQMRRAPGFTAVAVVTLALGIGANSAIFALADAVLLRPLPFPHADRLVRVEEWGPQQGGRSRVELLNFHEWRRQSRTFEAMAAAWVPAEGGGPVMTGRDGAAETVSAQTVTPQLFDVLGVAPIMGRTFADADDSTDPRVIVLSEGFWKRRFGGDPSIVGRTITLDERPHTVIGIVPDSFEFIRRSSIWRLLPLPAAGVSTTTRGQCGMCQLLQVVGRLKPGVSSAAAQAEMTTVANALAERNGAGGPRRIVVTPFRDVLIGSDLRTTSMLFFGVVGLVLLLCCANVANLVLARMTVRQRELAVRGALGAGRGRIAAQLLTESLVLAGLGGAAGFALAGAILAVAPGWVPPDLLPGVVTLGLDARVAGFCVGATLLVGVLFGLAPVWHVTHAPLVEAMNAEGRTSTGRGSRLRRLLVTAEIAAAVVVLCGAGLLLRTSLVLGSVDPGYGAAPDRIVSGEVSAGTRHPTSESLQQFFDAVQREVEGITGVRSVAWATTLPMGHSNLGHVSFQVVGAETPPADAGPVADLQIVSNSYFGTVDVPIVAGRPFTSIDTATSPLVAIVSEAFARRYLPGRNPIGAQITFATRGATRRHEIVGVARQVKERPDEPGAFVQLYVPSTQTTAPETRLLVRAAQGDALRLVPAIRAAIARVDPLLPLNHIATLEEVAGDATARPRFRTALVAAFAMLALTLAMVGVSGVLAYSVRQRRREFGVRLALGATARHIRALVWSDAARVLGTGVAIGLIAALLLGQSLSAFLFGVAPRDPLTLAAVIMVIALTAAGAAFLPAWRASRTDPAIVFRDV